MPRILVPSLLVYYFILWRLISCRGQMLCVHKTAWKWQIRIVSSICVNVPREGSRKESQCGFNGNTCTMEQFKCVFWVVSGDRVAVFKLSSNSRTLYLLSLSS